MHWDGPEADRPMLWVDHGSALVGNKRPGHSHIQLKAHEAEPSLSEYKEITEVSRHGTLCGDRGEWLLASIAASA